MSNKAINKSGKIIPKTARNAKTEQKLWAIYKKYGNFANI